MSFRILVSIYCHNIPTHTLESGWHGVTEVAKTAKIAKMVERCINCIERLSHSAPYKMESGPGNTFSAQNKKKRFMIFDPKKGGSFFRNFGPPPHPPPHPSPHLPQNLKKVGFKWWGLGGGGPETHRGMCLLDKIMIVQGVKLTIQPLAVGYANRPKKAQNRGVCGVFSYIRLA